ncbi:MAG TPA: hypothetical protein VE684_20335, partial [Crenalkalicoccus sp.]|nr:hypothetical protein [Crenalkalicoccus sp.]
FLTARDIGGTDVLGGVTSDLLAQIRLGTVTLAPGSVVQITGEAGADQVVYDSASTPFLQSRLAFTGSAFLAQQGAIVQAPAASLRISGDLPRFFDSVQVGGATIGDYQSLGRMQLAVLDRDAVIDVSGLKNIEVPVSRNLIQVLPFRNELRDDPLQRDGLLYQSAQRQQSITVDTRLGTSLFDWQPTALGRARSVQERQGFGGSVQIVAERVFTLAGSLIDVSGGTLAYQGGLRPAETRLVGADGRIYPVSTAPQDVTYVGYAGQFSRYQQRWGLYETWSSPLAARTQIHEPGYVEGFDAGSVTITGRFYGDGVIQGSAITGPRQAQAARANDGDPQSTTDLPNGGSLTFLAEPLNAKGTPQPRVDANNLPVANGPGALVNPTFVETTSPALPEDFVARLVRDPAQPASGDARYALQGGPLPVGRFDSQISAANIVNRGFSSVSVAAEGRLTVAAGVTLSLAPGSKAGFTANAWSADIQGSIVVPGGRISITTNAGDRITAVAETLAQPRVSLLPTQAPKPGTAPLDGAIRVGPGATLSTAGRWVNDYLVALSGGGDPGGSAFIDGGSISLTTRYSLAMAGTPDLLFGTGLGGVRYAATAIAGRDIMLATGSVLDVSGGGYVSTSGATTAGRGGALALTTFAAAAATPTGYALAQLPIDPNAGAYIAGRPSTVLDQGATLLGHGTAAPGGGSANGLGGSLSITVPGIVIGRAATAEEVAAGALSLDPATFAAEGFASISLTATTGGGLPLPQVPGGRITLAPGAVIAPVAAARLLDARSRTAPTGSPAGDWSTIEVPDPTDRSPTRLTLKAQNGLDAGDAATTILADPGAARSDSQALIALSSPTGILWRGTLSAPAGSISLTGTGSADSIGVRNTLGQPEFELVPFDPAQAIWIADTARLLAPGVAQAVVDARGLLRGNVRAGGAISLNEGRGYLVVAAGAVLDVSGVTGMTTQLAAGTGALSDRATSLALPGDAGAISLRGARGAYLDGTLLGQPGGSGAKGGMLTLDGSPVSLQPYAGLASSVPPLQGGTAPIGILVRSDGPTLPEGDAPGRPVDPTLRRDPVTGLYSGGQYTDRSILATARLAGSGIESVYLKAGNTAAVLADGTRDGGAVVFQGPVTLAAGRQVQIESPVIGTWSGFGVTATAAARIAAPYVVLDSGVGQGGVANTLKIPNWAATLAGSLRVDAGVLDLFGGGGLGLFGPARATLASASDIRFLGVGATASTSTNTNLESISPARILLWAQGDLTLQAAQLYPTTGADVTIQAYGGPGEAGRRSLTIQGLGGPAPAVPFSVGGTLRLLADSIVQGGVVRAPEGVLQFGATDPAAAVQTRSVRFLPGSLTSVSLEGGSAPFGVLRTDQTPTALSLRVSDVLNTSVTIGGLAALPEKSITIGAAAAPVQEVAIGAGAVLDASGGGQLITYQFVPGPGGSRDVLARAVHTTAVGQGVTASNYQYADQRDVYAIIPGAQALAAPYSPFITDSGSTLGRGSVTSLAGSYSASGAQPYVGDRITIGAGVPGLAAGTYTLLPGRYAILPGAYRVVIAPNSAAPRLETPLAAAIANPDGSTTLSGWRSIAGTGAVEARSSLVQVSPASSWTRYTQLNLQSTDSYFRSAAQRQDTLLPRLVADAGTLAIAAADRLVLDGTTRFAIGEQGRGGLAEITATRIAVTPGGAPFADPSYLAVSDAGLSRLGAETVILGGTVTRSKDGTALAVSAQGITVASGAALSAPTLVLVAG